MLRRTLATALAFVFAFALPGTGGAAPVPKTFPGSNGVIAYAGNKGIFVVNPDGTNAHRLISSPAPAYPAWSPGGTKVSFVDNGQIWVANADGTDVHQVTTSPMFHAQPSWSPDGTAFAFNSGGNLWTVNVDGTNEQMLTQDSTPDQGPVWSPDGESIVFGRWNGDHANHKIFLIDADGTDLRQLTGGGGTDDRYPDWAPSGKKILFWRDLGFEYRQGQKVYIGALRTITPDGTDGKVVAQGIYRYARYSPNGRQIVTIMGNAQTASYGVMSTNGTGLTKIIHLGQSATQVGGAVWQPLPPV